MIKKLLLALYCSVAMLACDKTDDTSSSEDGHIAASQVPAAATSSFNTKYPTASGQIEWETEHSNTYKVKFFIGSQRWQARFTASGTYIDEKMIS